jgi:hypothetical protein
MIRFRVRKYRVRMELEGVRRNICMVRIGTKNVNWLQLEGVRIHKNVAVYAL